MYGAGELRKLGSRTILDLPPFDHALFWRQIIERQWRFFDLDFERSGRWHMNQINNQKRKQPVADDYRLGARLIREHGLQRYVWLCRNEWKFGEKTRI